MCLGKVLRHFLITIKAETAGDVTVNYKYTVSVYILLNRLRIIFEPIIV